MIYSLSNRILVQDLFYGCVGFNTINETDSKIRSHGYGIEH